MKAFVTAIGFADASGVGSNRETVAGSPREAFGLKWSEISARPFERFGRLDVLCKYGITAAEMLGVEDREGQRHNWGIVLGTHVGSAAVDAEFIHTIDAVGGPSPALFSYTLPSTLLGELSIRHRITGANICLSAGPSSGEAALWEAAHFVCEDGIEACIAVAAEAAGGLFADGAVSSAYAFLIEKAPAEGRTVLARVAFGKRPPEARENQGIGALVDALRSRRPAEIVIAGPCCGDSEKALLLGVN